MKKRKILVIAASSILFLGSASSLISCGEKEEEVVTNYILEVKKEPSKTTFLIGERFSLSGLEVVKYTQTGDEKSDPITLSESEYILSLKEGTLLEEVNDDLTCTLSIEDTNYTPLVLHFVVRDYYSYTVTFKNYDNTVLSTQIAKEGDTSIIYNGAYPYKKCEEEGKVYLFKGWYLESDPSKTIVDLTNYVFTQDVTFIADYEESDTISDDLFYYNLNEEGYLEVAELKSKNDAEGNAITEIYIPSHCGDFEVKAIQEDAFTSNKNLTKVEMADSILRIGANAFKSCSNITTLSLSKNLEKIDDAAFSSCTSLTSITIPGSCKEIGEKAFNTSSQTTCTSITFEEGVEKIGANAFSNYAMIESLTLPDSLLEIGEEAFIGWKGLVTVHLGKNLSSIKESGFLTNNTQRALESYTVSDESEYFKAVDGVLYSKDMKTLVAMPYCHCPLDDDGNVVNDTFTVPESVETIGYKAFAYQKTNGTHLTYSKVVFGSNVKVLEDDAFIYSNTLTIDYSLSKLEIIGKECFKSNEKFSGSVEMLDSVTTIDDNAFESCKNITDFYFGTGMQVFGNNIFKNVKGITLHFKEGNENFVIEDGVVYSKDMKECVYYFNTESTSYSMPNTVEKVHSYFLNGNTTLTSLTLSTSLKTIEEYAFQGVSKVESALVVSNSVKEIGDYAFKGMSKVTSINIPQNLEKLGSYAFSSMTSLAVDELTIPSTIQEIGNNCFSSMKGVKKFVFNTTLLSESMFNKNTGVEEILLSDDTISIPISFASDATSLKTINVPSKLEEIKEKAFYKSSALSTFDIGSLKNLTTIEEDAFQYSGISEITVPESVTTFGTGVFAFCTSLLKAVINAKLLELPDYTFQSCSSLSDLTLPDSLTRLGKTSLKGLAIESIEVGSNVKTIDDSCFDSCTSLKEVSLPEGLTRIGNTAFTACSSLETINIPSTLEDTTYVGDDEEEHDMIGYMIFYKCSSLKHIDIPSNVKEIKSGMFQSSGLTSFEMKENQTLSDIGSQFKDCTNLESITFNSLCTSLPSQVLSGCQSLEEIKGLDKVTSIKSSALNGCKALTSIPFSLDNVEEIGTSAFVSCTKLESISLENNTTLTELSNSLFNGCSSLSGNIVIPSNVVTLGKQVFYGCSKLSEVTFNASTLTTTVTKSGYFFKSSGVSTVNLPNMTSEDAQSVFTTSFTGLSKGKLTLVCSDGTVTV